MSAESCWSLLLFELKCPKQKYYPLYAGNGLLVVQKHLLSLLFGWLISLVPKVFADAFVRSCELPCRSSVMLAAWSDLRGWYRWFRILPRKWIFLKHYIVHLTCTVDIVACSTASFLVILNNCCWDAIMSLLRVLSVARTAFILCTLGWLLSSDLSYLPDPPE